MARAFAKLPLFVAYYRRAYPRYVKLKQDLAAGRLGTIQSVSYVFARRPAPPRAGDWRLDAERSGGGKFVDIGSHALDLIDFLLGPLERVRASATRARGAGRDQGRDALPRRKNRRHGDVEFRGVGVRGSARDHRGRGLRARAFRDEWPRTGVGGRRRDLRRARPGPAATRHKSG